MAQREHYLAGSVARFSVRWWTSTPLALAMVGLAAVGIAVSPVVAPVAALTGLVAIVGPPGLSIRGRTGPLAWTRRLRTLAVVSGTVICALAVAAAASPAPLCAEAAVVVLVGILIDASLFVLAPIERRIAAPWVKRAAERLERVGPSVVAITGSYGKTSTKHHLAELLSGSAPVVPTPRSFNNTAGLARAVNDHLASGTKVFIAEMGTYGPGEIRAMCAWCRPDVAVLTAIGPVHLERFGSLEAITAAKAEIAERASTVVCNVDDERLRALAGAFEAAGTPVVRAGSVSPEAVVRVEVVAERWRVIAAGETVLVTSPIPGIQATNLACALAAGIALGYDARTLAARIPHVAPVANRLTVAGAPSGVLIIDDTYNSNPTGAGAAIELLASLPVDGRRVVVTPGMVELGRRQATENEAFAGAAARIPATVVVVGRTNRAALAKGAAAAGAECIEVATRERAVDWVRATLGHGDAVLYENDLPDHYP